MMINQKKSVRQAKLLISAVIFLQLMLLLFLAPGLSGATSSEEEHFQAGAAYYLKGETEAAIGELNKSLQINPDYEKAKNLLAKISASKIQSDKLLSLDLKNADLNDVLRLFSQEYGFNIVAGKEVAGTVTISFVNVPVEDALRAILGVNGFGYEKIGNLILVSAIPTNRPLATTTAMITRIFTLGYVNAEQIKEIIQAQLSPHGTVTVMTNFSRVSDSTEYSGEITGGGARTQNAPVGTTTKVVTNVDYKSKEQISNVLVVVDFPDVLARIEKLISQLDVKPPLTLRVFTLNYISAEKIEGIVRKQLSPIGTVDVMTNLYIGGWQMSGVSTEAATIGQKKREATVPEEKPRILIVVDSPDVLARIEILISQLDVKPSQILIEAMIVEIGSEYVRDIGIDWDITKTNNLTYGLKTLTSPLFPIPTMFAGGGLSLNYANSPLTITIKALEKAGKANILSNPRIMALDNYPAAIMVGERYPIMTTTTTADALGKTLITGSLHHYEPIGISLRVIPHVNQKGAVEMILHPEVTSLGDPVASGTGDGTLILPRINSREADTNVTVKDGQTVVIGGLLTNETKDTSYKVPFLGDIPILGYLFKRTVKEPKKKELLIFITPHVVNESTDAAALLQEKTAQIK